MAPLIQLLIALAASTAPTPAPVAAEVEARPKRVCLPQAETREEIHAHHLLEPFAVLKSASTQFKAEALKVRLCRIGDEFVYEISLLHHDGRYVHVVMNAVSGKLIERRPREGAPKN